MLIRKNPAILAMLLLLGLFIPMVSASEVMDREITQQEMEMIISALEPGIGLQEDMAVVNELEAEEIETTLADIEEEPVEEVVLPETAKVYLLTEPERDLLHQAVMAEARGESYEGQMMVAQCILDGAIRNGFDIATAIERYRIATINMAPSDSVEEAVSAVFDRGERVTHEKADLWYAPGIVYSSWHEKQNYVATIGVHKFFWMKTSMN